MPHFLFISIYYDTSLKTFNRDIKSFPGDRIDSSHVREPDYVLYMPQQHDTLHKFTTYQRAFDIRTASPKLMYLPARVTQIDKGRG